MNAIFSESRRRFMARYLGDLSKAVFAVGLASKLFIDLPTWLRIALGVACIFFFILAYFIHPRNKGGKEE